MNKKKQKNSTKKYLKQVSVKTLSILTGIMIVFITFAFYIINNMVETNIINFENEKVQKASEQASAYFQQSISTTIFLSQMVSIPLEELDENSKHWQSKIYRENLTAAISGQDYISNACLYLEDYCIETGSINKDIEMRTLGVLYNIPISVPKDIQWPYFMRISYHSKSNNTQVYLDVNLKYLSRLILPENTYITDTSGNILMSMERTDYGKNISEIHDISLKEIKQSKSSSYFTHIVKIDRSDLYCCTVTPKSIYAKQYAFMLIGVMGIGGLLLIILLIVTYKVIRKIYKPINEIVETFKYHLPYDVSEFENDVAYINTNIRNTLAAKNELESQMKENIVKLKTAQANALQSQINPHFLLNTLENIKWLSVETMGFDNPIAESLIYLNCIVSESLNQRETLTNVSTEVSLAKNYIALMQIRYRNAFDVDWDIHKNCVSGTIIKLTLQPLLENSIIHGFRQDKKDQHIYVKVMRKDANLEITVSDNGAGIPAKKLLEIKSSLQNSDKTPPHHIGLLNIDLRIKLLFGDNYGITSFKSSDLGTKIQVLLPYTDFLP